MTFSELQTRSNQLANYLRSIGVGPGDLVGLCCDRVVETPALLVGILKSGAGYVPLDPEYPVDRLRYMVDNSEVKHVIAHASQRHLTDDFNATATLVDDEWETIAKFGDSRPDVTVDVRHDVAYVIYTSGSTGKPKGVMVPHRPVVNMLWSMTKSPGFNSEDRILATTTLSFDISVIEMFLPLICGGSVVVVDRATAKDTAKLIATVDQFDVNYMQATPAMWRMILEADFSRRDGMKFLTGGEPLPRDLIRPMLERCDELWNMFGPTETTVYSTLARITSGESTISIGRPFANTQVFVVDDHDQLCEPGTPGELLIAGDGLALGYLKRPELTAEKFCTWNGRTVYRTGDLARLFGDGELEHLGRMDSQIKFNGHRIELEEIDAELAKQESVRQAATAVQQDGNGRKRLVAYVLAMAGKTPNAFQIRQSLSQTLPDYMIPNVVETVQQFPYTPSGKLDRKAFPPPNTQRPDLHTDYVAPESEIEKQIAKIWGDVLQIDRVGVHDNFLHLGGDSMRAAAIVARVEQETGLPLTVGQFFDRPTIKSFLNDQDTAQKINHVGIRSHSTHPGEFAIVGMAARMPGASTLAEYWENLIEGRESIKFFTEEELDPSLDAHESGSENYVRARGVIDGADRFDAEFFQLPPKFAEMMDPQQRVLLELAWVALEDAGVVPSRTEERIGVWAGAYSSTYFTKNLLTNPGLIRDVGEFNVGVYNEKDYIATRIAHALNLRGPAINVNTACSTSLVAVIEACKSIQAGDCDLAIAGGVSIQFPQASGHLHQTGSIFSPDGHCRPFDSEAAGTMFCDGAGLVVLKRLEDAQRDSDRIYAVVKGYGINNDGGEKASFSAPSIRGQADAIAMAQRMAAVHPETISYIEAHGTATPVGDPIEVTALQSVFESKTDKKQFCAIGSVKSNIGHTVAAAGAAGLIKVAMSLFHERLPATLHYESPNRQIDFESTPFFVCDSLMPWNRGKHPRRAGVSSFGVGGTNAHLVVEEAPKKTADHKSPGARSNRLPLSLIPVSGKTKSALDANLERLQTSLSDQSLDLHRVSSTMQFGREAFPYRAVLVASSIDELRQSIDSRRDSLFKQAKASSASRDIVFMFPGQGSQYVRMGQGLYEHSTVFRESLDQCATILHPLLDRDLREVMFARSGNEAASQEILKNTRFTQPALFALGYSLAKTCMSWGILPSAMVGHSIGEFAAACVAGIFELEDGLRIIAERGRVMQELPAGSMMSVKLPGADVEPLLWGEMAIGAFNGPSLCVVSGPKDQVATLREQLESQEVVCRLLHTSHAFHSPMMDSIVEPFQEFVSQFPLRAPTIPICSTVTGDWITDQQSTDPAYWANHLRAPVRFSDAITRIWCEHDGDPRRILVELGPRRTLATLAKQHAADAKKQLAIPTLFTNQDAVELDAFEEEWRSTVGAVAQLWCSGVRIDWRHLSTDGRPIRKLEHLTLPTYSFQRQRYFVEPGVGIQGLQANDAPTHSEQPQQSRPSKRSGLQEASRPFDSQEEAVSRVPAIIKCVQSVFENTSGFDLSEFDNDTTFFEMGLDSLVLTQTASAFKKELDVEVSFRQLLEETTTVGELGKWLDECLPREKFSSPAASQVDDDCGRPEHPSQTAETVAGKSAPNNFASSRTTAESVIQMQLQAQLQLMQQQLRALGSQYVSGEQLKRSEQQEVAAIEPLSSGSEHIDVRVAKADQDSRQIDEADLAPKAKRFKTVKLSESALDDRQQRALDEIIRMNNLMMPRSKKFAQEHRRYLADPRTVSGFRPNMKEMTHPIVVDRSKGVQLWDIDGNEYIDFTCGFGSNLLGHTHEVTTKAIKDQIEKDYAIGPQSPLAGDVARLFCELTGSERMAFSNTGSEAVLGCTRLARNATG
ncbi:MAG: amino acid adenylation domain-containing protein, partial [Planctomycetota bacterium]